MSRLPVPGNDDGVWGEVLNDFLLQSHTGGGQLKSDSVGSSQLQDGAVTDTKLSSGVQSAIAQGSTAVRMVNGISPDQTGNVVVVGSEGPQGPAGVAGQNGQDGQSITVTLVPTANWPAPADPDPLHWYVKVP